MYQFNYFLLSIAILIATATSFSVQLNSCNSYQNVNTNQQQRYRNTIFLTNNKKNTALFASDEQVETQSITKTQESAAVDDEEEDDDEEWEFEEYEMLTEKDFYNSEWKVGTVMDGSKKIEETWTRLIVQEGEFICIWGDGSNGKWNFDPASQFLSMSKDSYGGWLGKRIWAGNIDDFYYVQGSIRGWSPISPASVVGQWQAKRLGVDKDEAGIAPWFEEEEEVEEEETDAIAETKAENDDENTQEKSEE